MSLKSVLVLACIASASAFSKLRACAGFNYDECGVCRGPGIAPGTCDCDGTLPDCANMCGGTSTFDVCGVCGGPGLTEGRCNCNGDVELGCGCGEPGPTGCDEACGSTAVVDECGVCGGDGMPESDCDCDGNVYDECGTCGGTGIPEGECDCDGNVYDECEVCGGTGSDDQGCGCFKDPPSGCDLSCGSTLVLDKCGVCGGIGITDQMCDCVDPQTGVPDFTCIPSDPAGFEIAVDSQQGILSVDKSFTFSIDLGDLPGRSRALNENNWCIKGNCEFSQDFPPRDRQACDTCDGTETTIIVGFEVKVIQELSGKFETQQYTLEEIFVEGGIFREEDNLSTDEVEESYLDRYGPEFAFARDREFSIDIKSCGEPRFNEATNECDPYEVWTGGDTFDGEEDEKCFSNVCTGMPEFDESGESRTEDIIYFRQNSYVVKVRSIGCEGTVEDLKDPINTCTGSLRKGSFDDYCYEDLLYNNDVKNVDKAAELYQKRKDSEYEVELCPSLAIEEAYNKIEGTQGQGIFVIDFNKDCDSEIECASSCPDGQCEYPEIDHDACTEVDACAGCNFDGNGNRVMGGACEYNGMECFLKDEGDCKQDCHCVPYSFYTMDFTR